jgi:putative membrane protein
MQTRNTFLPMGLLILSFFLIGFGCERSNPGVQAARETPNPSRAHGTQSAFSEADKTFIKAAEDAGIDERNLGREVMERSSNEDVKNFAKAIVNDDSKTLEDLVDLMQKQEMKQPSGMPEVKHEALAELKQLSGPALDREYVNLMIQELEKNVDMFRREQGAAQNQAVRDYAKERLPVLEKHLQEAQELQKKLAGQ